MKSHHWMPQLLVSIMLHLPTPLSKTSQITHHKPILYHFQLFLNTLHHSRVHQQWFPSCSFISFFLSSATKILSSNSWTSVLLYLKNDSTADDSGGDVLLFVGYALDFTKLVVQLSVYVGEHRPHRATGYVEDVLTADHQERQQHEAKEEFGNQGPHCPTLIPSKSTRLAQSNARLQPQSRSWWWLLLLTLLLAKGEGNSCSPLLSLVQSNWCFHFISALRLLGPWALFSPRLFLLPSVESQLSSQRHQIQPKAILGGFYSHLSHFLTMWSVSFKYLQQSSSVHCGKNTKKLLTHALTTAYTTDFS